MPGIRALRILIAALLCSSAFLPTSSGQSVTGGGSPLFGGDRPRPLPIEQAFPFFVSLPDTSHVSVTWQIAPDHYLYRHQFGFALESTGTEARRLVFQLPAGEPKQDQFFGDIEAYYDTVTATLELDSAQFSGASLVIEFQGCAEWGFCYPPQRTVYPLNP